MRADIFVPNSTRTRPCANFNSRSFRLTGAVASGHQNDTVESDCKGMLSNLYRFQPSYLIDSVDVISRNPEQGLIETLDCGDA